MRKLRKRIGICCLLAVIVWGLGILRDRKILNENLIRFHVVANSDDPLDQRIKLWVKDAVVESLQEDLNAFSDTDEARNYLADNLPRIQQTVNSVLQKCGADSQSIVTLCSDSYTPAGSAKVS